MIFIVRASSPPTNFIGTKCWRSLEWAKICIFTNILKKTLPIPKKCGRHQQPFGPEKQSSQSIISLKFPSSNLVSQNPSEFPDIMNKYFSSIGHNLASKMPNSPKQFTDYLPKLDFASSFFFNHVSPSEIDSEITTIRLNKAHGLYSFPTRILRSAKHIWILCS